jgi:hypothetical protein
MMRPRPNRHFRLLHAGALLLATMAAACNGPPSLDEADLVAVDAGTERGSAKAAAIREMRAKAEAAEYLDYPDVFANPGVDAPEPLPVRDVLATQERLVATARSRTAPQSPAEVAAGQARALQLRRLALARKQEAERLIQASGAQ